jgi:hypothetical protein
MNKVLRILLENWLKTLVVYGILWAGFRYWLEFDNKQSIVFAIFFGGFYFGLKEVRTKGVVAEDFIPYTVNISVTNWHDLLLKFKFVQNEEEWKKLCESVKETSVLRRGLNFTVLSLSKEGLPHLIWLDDHKIFRAGILSFEEELEGIAIAHERPMITSHWSPRLYFGFHHAKGRGYTLALCVRDTWWEKNKTTATAKIETDIDHMTGSTYLVLATLPYGEIGLDYEKRGQERDKELTACGWRVEDKHDSEMNWHMTKTENEYFSVSQRDCEMD